MRPMCCGRSALLLIAIYAGIVNAQDYPSKPVRIVCSPPGGGGDFLTRVIAQEMMANTGWQVVVENRPVGITEEVVSKAPADGYTLLLDGAFLWIGPLLQKRPYDPVADFAPISLTHTAANVLVIHPSLPVKSVKELVALAKNRPGELNYGSTQAGGSTHLAAELFNSLANVRIIRIPYKGGGPLLNGLIGGEVQINFATAASVQPHVKAGRLRALAVTSPKPSQLAPGLPPVAEAVPGYEYQGMYAMAAPARTPEAVIRRLNQEIVRVLNKPEAREKFLGAGVETVGSSPDELAATIKADMARMGKVIKSAGITAE